MPVWQSRKPARFGVVFMLLTVCASTQITQPNSGNLDSWHKLDAGPFSISAPSGWEFHQLTGVDSYVGEFVGDGMTLTFDLGRYSTELRHAKTPAYIITKESIDGRGAKVVSPRTPGNGITGVLVRLGVHEALCLWGNNLSAEQGALAFKVFNTLRFGGATPPSLVPPPPPPVKHAE